MNENESSYVFRWKDEDVSLCDRAFSVGATDICLIFSSDVLEISNIGGDH
jgi:hypothetical protein